MTLYPLILPLFLMRHSTQLVLHQQEIQHTFAPAMKYLTSTRRISFGMLLLFCGCELFSPSPDKKQIGPLSLSIATTNRKLTDTLHISLSWQYVDQKDSTQFIIDRRADLPDTSPWNAIGKFYAKDSTYTTDVINDDITYRYRIIADFRSGGSDTSFTKLTIPPTTSLTFPGEIDSLNRAPMLRSLDDGDTISVLPGWHETGRIHFGAKHLVLRSTAGAAETVLHLPSAAHMTQFNIDISPFSIVTMNGGELDGFTLTNGQAGQGGGARANGTSIIRHCAIIGNIAVASGFTRPAYGGGVLLSDDSRLENSIVASNSLRPESVADIGGGGIYVRYGTGVVIENVTVVSNNMGGIELDSTSTATIRNSIVWDNSVLNLPPFDLVDEALNVTYSIIEGGYGMDSTNQNAAPDIDADFRLLGTSPAVDGGDPNPDYFDVDGSRNDIGAFGGPGGAWSGAAAVGEIE